MIGTIVNTATILLGSFIGSIAKKGIKEEYKGALFTAMGLAATALGINAIVNHLPDSEYPVLFIISLAAGSLIGTIIDIEGRFQRLSKRFSSSDLGQGLSTATLIFCIGTLSILGPIESALHGDHTFLFTNATLDFVTSMVFASAYGIGIAIAIGIGNNVDIAVILFCWQGAIYMIASLLGAVISTELMTELSIVGGILIASSGLSILGIKDCKTMNLLPSLLIPVIWFLIKNFFS